MVAGLSYPGGRPFQRTDSGRFFGRAAEAAELREIWLRNPLTFMYGPAGIGKTSLLAAGVLPLIEGNNIDLLPVGGFSKGSSYPVAAPAEYTPYTLALLRSWSTRSTVSRLRRLTVDEFVARHAELRDPAVLMLAAIDQADDLFAGPRSRQQQRQRFLRELRDALQEPSLRLLISVRDEALPRFTDAIGDGVQFRLNALMPEQACRAVEGPGLFEPTAARELVEAVRTSWVVTTQGRHRRVVADLIEPALLQVVCARLWESLQARSAVIRRRDLRRRGDVDAALSAYYSEMIAAVADIHDIPVSRLRFWLIHAFITDIGSLEAVGDLVAESVGLPTTVTRALEDRYLLRAQAGQPASSRLYQLISDRVIEPLRRTQDDVAPAEDPGEYLLAAERALVAGDVYLAERYAAKAHEAAPRTALLLHAQLDSLLGNLACEKGDLEQGIAHYRNAASLFEATGEHGSVALLLAAIGRTLATLGDLLAAINELRAAVMRMPADGTIQAELSAAVQELAWRLTAGDRGPSISAD